ncbi:Flp pilus assembly protein CpaB [Ethanoligenens sp.]|uniref:Flp pilus assembly protein CpaB n=1 Tax=Ethanoligenens sp. TaxID=2099655 RepID=UPI0039EAB367
MNKKNKQTIGVLCIAAAVAVGGLYWYALHASMAGVSVVRAKTEIPAGTKITSDMLETVEMGKLNLPANITGNAGLVIGAYANTQLSTHEIITGDDLSGHPPTYALADGEMLYSIPMKNLADSLSGKLQAGDIVRVAVPQQSVAGNNTAAQNNSLAALQDVRVTSVTGSNGQEVTQNTSVQTTSSGTSSSANQPATVTLLVNQQQLNALAALGQQEIQLALVSRGNEKQAESLLAGQSALLKGAD